MRIRPVIRRLWFQGQQHSFLQIDHEIFSSHSLTSANSRRAVVSFWQKHVHNTGYPFRGLSLPSKSVVRLTDLA